MALYTERILPGIVDRVCQTGPMMRQRKKLIPRASGHVLEIGIGSGLNIPFYDTRKVKSLTGLEPSRAMASMASRRAGSAGMELTLLIAGAESIPVNTSVMDTVVMTYTMCTIPDTLGALREIRRVMKPDGELLFCEHGLAPDEKTKKWQNSLTPVWKRIAGGCHLNRDIQEILGRGGFRIKEMETAYLPGWKPAGFNYLGIAEKSFFQNFSQL